MALSQIGTINTKDDVLNRIQAEIQARLNPVLTCPLLNGVLVSADLLAAGVNSVAHGLGRAPQGWILVSPGANAVVWGDVVPAAKAKQILLLNTTADVSVKLWVF